jgi:hypothetical protein
MTSSPRVAILLATYNGTQFLEPQLRSLTDNETRFTLHWLDDGSTDDTRRVVRESSSRLGIDLVEWHQERRLGVPAAFFQLLECVEADVYLFCDQDDIWQPGKIDATVESLSPQLDSPVLCYSEPWLFATDAPAALRSYRDVLLDAAVEAGWEISRAFMYNPAPGNTVGFTRQLRGLFMAHRQIARSHAAMHDWWMYLIARASDGACLLKGVPTTLYRQHGGNAVGVSMPHGRRGLARIPGAGSRLRKAWAFCQDVRRSTARQALGFMLAADTMPAAEMLQRMLPSAQCVAKLCGRQSPAALIRLARQGVLPPHPLAAAWLAAACLVSDAGPSPLAPDPAEARHS